MKHGALPCLAGQFVRQVEAIQAWHHDQRSDSTSEVAHGVVLYPQLDCLDDSTEEGSNNILKVDLE